jgi:hypothetical protein
MMILGLLAGCSPAPTSSSASLTASPTATPSPSPSPTTAPPIPSVRPSPAPIPPAEIEVAVAHETAVSLIPKSVDDRAWEPVVATHPTDPDTVAVVYQHRGPGTACGLNPTIRISHDGGLSWRSTKKSPAAGSGRGVSLHASIAWGPGPSAGSSRLYWANMTTPGCGDGRFSPSTAYSDDEGATWSKLRVERDTPPWVGGMPEVAVDRNPASPNFGTVYVGYNWLAPGAHGPGFHLLASADFGATWASTEIAPAAGPRGYGDWWRIGYRLRPAPDGGVYASWYQVNMRRWDRTQIFAKGGPANVGRLGVAVARVEFGRVSRKFAVGPSQIAVTVPETAYSTSGTSAAGTAGNIRPDPMWLHGFDVDQATGRLYLAVAAYGPGTGGAPRGTIQVGRSDDGGATWSFARLPSAGEIGGRRQSSIRPNLVAGHGSAVVTFHTLDDVQGGVATIGNAFTVSTDEGATWRTPAPVSKERWRASNLGGVINGTGLRERAERLADGNVFWAYGDGRYATGSKAGRVAIVGSLIRVDVADICRLPAGVARRSC